MAGSAADFGWGGRWGKGSRRLDRADRKRRPRDSLGLNPLMPRPSPFQVGLVRCCPGRHAPVFDPASNYGDAGGGRPIHLFPPRVLTGGRKQVPGEEAPSQGQRRVGPAAQPGQLPSSPGAASGLGPARSPAPQQPSRFHPQSAPGQVTG